MTQLSKRNRKRSSRAGVTLIEMLVVVTIIGLFVALVAPGLWKKGDESKTTLTRSQIDNFMTALGTYKLDTGMFPTTEQGLAALRIKPADVNQWNGPYLPKDVPKIPGPATTSTATLANTRPTSRRSCASVRTR